MTTAVLPARPAGGTAPIREGSRALRADQVGVVLGLALLPLLDPPGPANSGVADVGLGVAITTWLLTSRACGRPLRVPYLLATSVSVCAGAVAVAVAGSHSGLLPLAQDVLLLLWAASVAAVVARDDRGLALVLRAWVLTGLISAAATLGGAATGTAALSGVTPADGSRAAATLGDPNLAANWFLVSLLVLRAARWPRRAVVRWSCCGALLAALLLTASNGGLLGLVVATAFGAVVAVARTRGPAAAAALLLGALLLGAAVVTRVDWTDLRARAADTVPVLHDSLGRSGDSGASRGVLLSETLRLAGEEGLLGIGPGATRETLRHRQAAYAKEAHDDYVAALLERGLLGALGLVLLVQTLVLRTRLALEPARRERFRELVPRPELLAAALVATALSAAFYEVLHFRHVWALFGLVAGLSARSVLVARR